ncbi:MAG: hypothetical protein GX215_08515 [Clostridiales Family XIII bacterium]|jgi:hypothetical protein|nr:hypothetical protein [Clostridiales Family XIII bacterium]
MKKTIAILLMVVLILSLSGCEGNVSRVNIIDVDSEIYSKSEINDAIDIVLKHFKDYFKGCTLREIQYAGDDSYKEFEEWAEQYDAEQAIILISSFDVDSSGGDGSLNPNTTYDDWKWILTRKDNQEWTLQTWGY